MKKCILLCKYYFWIIANSLPVKMYIESSWNNQKNNKQLILGITNFNSLSPPWHWTQVWELQEFQLNYICSSEVIHNRKQLLQIAIKNYHRHFFLYLTIIVCYTGCPRNAWKVQLSNHKLIMIIVFIAKKQSLIAAQKCRNCNVKPPIFYISLLTNNVV